MSLLGETFVDTSQMVLIALFCGSGNHCRQTLPVPAPISSAGFALHYFSFVKHKTAGQAIKKLTT